MVTYAKEFNTPEPVLREMYWYDVILILNRYNEMMNDENNKNSFDDKIKQQHEEYTNQMNNIKMPSFNMSNMNSITSGIKIPKI